jgi:4-hydroxybenzoate polyprenyltransferase
MKKYLSFVKFQHTVFALPFALTGYVTGIHMPGQHFEWPILLLVLLCMVFARNAAMGFNRWADRNIDAKNPRTAVREIPSGEISPQNALWFVIFNALAFVIATYFINDLCFVLSPVALLVILGYSYTKRYTWLCHFILGLGLGLAPIGAYLAVTAEFHPAIVALGAGVFLWTSGFDIIYGLQDVNFDREEQLHSVPVDMGSGNALILSNLVHLISGLLLVYYTYWAFTSFNTVNVIIWIGLGAFLLLLIYQHLIVKVDDLSKVDLAFFTTNGVASVIYGLSVILDFYI